jgi:hypothetical protein
LRIRYGYALLQRFRWQIAMKNLLYCAAFMTSMVTGITAHAGAIAFEYSGNMVQYAVPVTGLYNVASFGAEGAYHHGPFTDGGSGGPGAEASGDFTLSSGQVLTILVGGEGQVVQCCTVYAGGSGGGGGGSFVVTGNTPLVIAGGGGGGGLYDNGGPGLSGTDGGAGPQSGGGAGGSAGNGGSAAGIIFDIATGGGGFATDGGGIDLSYPNSPIIAGGISFLNGGAGASGWSNMSWSSLDYVEGPGMGGGGYGGGGNGGGWAPMEYTGGGGGGGGYSGGGGGGLDYGISQGAGGGGGSYLDGSAFNGVLIAGQHSGNGEVDITLISTADIPEPDAAWLFVTGIGILASSAVLRQRCRVPLNATKQPLPPLQREVCAETP